VGEPSAQQHDGSSPHDASGNPRSAFLVEVGPVSPRRFDLLEVTTIGRDEASAVRLEDPLVARRHAEVRRAADGRYELVDLGSRNGTFVRGRRCSTAILEHGDEILVGPTRLLFEGASTPDLRKERANLRRSSDIVAHAAIELTTALESAADLNGLVTALLRTTLDLVEAERGAIVLLGTSDELPSIHVGLTRDGERAEIRVSTSLISEVVAQQAGVVTTSVPDDPRLNGAVSLVAQKVRCAMCVPLTHRGERLGVLHLDSRIGGAFTPANLELVSALARQASVAIRNAVLVEKVRSSGSAERRRLERLLSDLPDGVVLVDGDGRIAFANPRAPELLAAINGDGAAHVLERVGDVSIGALLEAREPVEIVVPGPSKRVVIASAHEASEGVAGSVVVVLRDVTRDREREARVAHQERLAVMGQLAAGVAHDFNNLLAIITNYAQFVMDELRTDRARDDQQQVLEAASRAAQLVKQLLAFGRRDVVHPQVVRLDRVIGSLERLVRGSVGEHIEVRTTFARDLARVKVDPSSFGQVVLNLAVNARDAMPRGGTLTFRAYNRDLDEAEGRAEAMPPGRYAVLDVTDTGVGMPARVASRVFEPFFTTKGAGKGTGLGLATAYGVVKQAGGAILLRTKEGEGTTFSVLLPATDEAATENERGPQRSARAGETILLVEDECLVRDLTRRILVDAGYKVFDASSGVEALEVASKIDGPLDLLLTDVVMPNMTGKQLVEKLSAERPGLRVMYMSGYFDDALGSDIHRHFIAKPFHRDALLSRVRAALTTRDA
jgi:signal transduction histidine kinase